MPFPSRPKAKGTSAPAFRPLQGETGALRTAGLRADECPQQEPRGLLGEVEGSPSLATFGWNSGPSTMGLRQILGTLHLDQPAGGSREFRAQTFAIVELDRGRGCR